MKWIKHDTDANQDAKLQNVLLDYGLEGYGLYWYCIELIAGKVDKDSITFELEHDARIIARNTGSSTQEIEEMMKYFVEIGLFENSQGVITCLKLARRLDKSMTSNTKMRDIIENLKNQDTCIANHDSVMTQSENHMQDKNRIDKNRIDKNRIDKNRIDKVNTSDKSQAKKVFDEDDVKFSEWFYQILLTINPNHKKPNFESSGWADSVRLMRERDGRSYNEMSDLFIWVINDDFWKSNILSPKKLREKWDALKIKSAGASKHTDINTIDYITPLIDDVQNGKKRF